MIQRQQQYGEAARLSAMERLLSDEDKRMLARVYTPVPVATPPEDARRSLCVLPDGEIRCYGQIDKPHPHKNGKAVYLSSRDCGLSWKMHEQKPGSIGASMQSPFSGRYVVVREGYDGFPGVARSIRSGEYAFEQAPGIEKGVFVYRSEQGPDAADCVKTKISEGDYHEFFLPKALRSVPRLIAACMRKDAQGDYHPALFISDDDGDTWVVRELPPTPKHTAVPPHRAVRWQNNGAEPIVTEFRDGTLWVLARTSLDVLYRYVSHDHGDTFEPGEPTDFHATLTTPSFTELSDGRVVLIWCNTQPLPEIPVDDMLPAFDDKERAILESGASEDVFTNRDAVHIAITKDGVRWRGFRELYLNPLRNQPDFRTMGDLCSGLDKSVQQSQAIELPNHKLLVSLGQHESIRKLLLLDIAWIEQTDRREDFGQGLGGVTTHAYVKSYSGCALCEGIAGHCQYNRTNGALLAPEGTTRFRESLRLCRVDDPRLLSTRQGVVWNFPACFRGQCDITLKIKHSGVSVCLTDRWYNASDENVRREAIYMFRLLQSDLCSFADPQKDNGFVTLSIHYDSTGASVFCKGTLLFILPKRARMPNGLSYLVIQSLAESADAEGTLIAQMQNRALTSSPAASD